MTFILKLDLDMIKMYHHTIPKMKFLFQLIQKFSLNRWTDMHTGRHTDRHTCRHYENITSIAYFITYLPSGCSYYGIYNIRHYIYEVDFEHWQHVPKFYRNRECAIVLLLFVILYLYSTIFFNKLSTK